jgi:hypothetical protein
VPLHVTHLVKSLDSQSSIRARRRPIDIGDTDLRKSPAPRPTSVCGPSAVRVDGIRLRPPGLHHLEASGSAIGTDVGRPEHRRELASTIP